MNRGKGEIRGRHRKYRARTNIHNDFMAKQDGNRDRLGHKKIWIG